MEFASTMPVWKRTRPYVKTFYTKNGSTGFRWWTDQPLPNEDVRAIRTLAMFTGGDDFVEW